MHKANNQRFLKNMVESASPLQLIVILYDGAIQWLQMSKKEINTHAGSELPNWSTFAGHMDKAARILIHLQESLDFTQSKEISEKLFDLYEFMKSELLQANIKKDVKRIDNVLDLLRDLKASWKEACAKEKGQAV